MIYAVYLIYALIQVSAMVFIRKVKIDKSFAVYLSLASLTVMLVWAVVMDNNASIYEYFPCKYGVIVYNLAPILLAVTLGITLTFNRFDVKRVLLYSVLLIGFNMYYYSSLFVKPFKCGNDNDGKVTLQTTDYTCSPASASTLFNYYGINVSEDEMARLCMTNTRGTSIGQLYYGMRVIADQNKLDVEVKDLNFEDLGKIDCPAIISVKLTDEVDQKDKRYRENWGWDIDVPHAVVYLGRNGDIVNMADPKIGAENWTVDAIRDLWTGKVLTVKKCD